MAYGGPTLLCCGSSMANHLSLAPLSRYHVDTPIIQPLFISDGDKTALDAVL